MLYRVYDQLKILAGIRHLSGDWEFLECHMGYEQLISLVGIIDANGNLDCWELQACYTGNISSYCFSGNQVFECDLGLLGILRVLYRHNEQLVIAMGIGDLNGK